MSFKDYFEVYEFECTLPGSKEIVKFRPLKTKDIKTLLNYEDDNPDKVEEVLDVMLQQTVLNEDFNIDNLYLQDRFFLTNEIRKKTKGETYEFEYDCPKCESQNYLVQNLDELEVTHLDENVDNKIDLTDKVSIYIWYISRGEEKEAFSYVDPNLSVKERNAEYQFNTLTQSIKSVESPDGLEENLSFSNKQFIIENVSINGLNKIRDWFQENNFGVDFRITKYCRQCNYQEFTTLPLQNFFF